jgi:hypothetical protein
MNRRGGALLAALLALLVAGFLAATILASARLRYLSGYRRLASAEASAAALGTVAWWGTEWRAGRWDDSVGIGQARTLPPSLPRLARVRTSDSLVRLGPTLLLVRSSAERLDGNGTVLAREGWALAISTRAPALPESAAVIAAGGVSREPGSVVSGTDHTPPGWEGACPPPSAGGSDVVRDTLPLSSLGASLADLMGTADARLSGVLVPAPLLDAGSLCDTAPPLNWGSPAGGPCRSHFPVILLEPETRIAGGTGQGLVIALGSIQLSGDFCYVGVIVALGSIGLEDSACVVGAVISAEAVSVAAGARIERSRCAIRRAGTGLRRPAPVSRGLWRWP